ncbi:MAG TPA: hypothetical protein VMT43_04580, partial [Acidimicrobiales bacterium]|nr:hypothetical protein [Acidimicrobiales bacterium]
MGATTSGRALRLRQSLIAAALVAATALVTVPGAPPAAGINPANPSCSSAVSPNGGTGAFYSNQFASNYVTAPPTGAADVPNAHFRNVFLFPMSSPTDTWDQHMQTLPQNQRGPTSEQIDAMTKDLVCSSYFDLLTQYNINPPTYDGDVATDDGCVTAAINDAMSTANVISYATMRTFAGCEQGVSSANPPQINIFVSPDLMASAYGLDTFALCSSDKLPAAYHGWGLGVPNFTVVPTTSSQSCNDPGNLLGSLSHEMVELVSDPGGFGWLHASDIGHVDLGKQLDDGELGDICSKVGAYPTPADNPGVVPFPSPPDLVNLGLNNLHVAPYWSDQDNACEPTSIMNDTLAHLSGGPLIRFTGSTHDLTIPITQVNPPAGILDSLELDVFTGEDNLNSSSAFNVVVDATVNGHTVHIQQNSVNQGAEWGGGSLHAALLSFPAGIPVSAITKVTIDTNLSGDNWDVLDVTVQAGVVPDTTGCGAHSAQLVDANAPNSPLLSDGHKGLVRMVGGAPQVFAAPMSVVPVNERNLVVTRLTLTLSTTGDDLRGGNSPEDNVDGVLKLQGGGEVDFPNLNRNMNLPSPSTQPNQLNLLTLNSLPPNTTAGDILSFELHTDLPGGTGGDNWDVGGIQLYAALGCAATSHPTLQTTTLVDSAPNTPLPDGSTGLCRLTGVVHHCTVPIPPSSLDSSDKVVSMSATIVTGDDDLRASGYQEDNANVTVGGFTTPFRNVNLFQTWHNGESHTFPLALFPWPSVTVGNVSAIDVSTLFGGGSGSDNWDIKEIKLDVTVAVTGSLVVQQGASSKPRLPGATLGALSELPQLAAPTVAVHPALAPTAPSPWTIVPSANPGQGDNALNGVTCLSATNCFAVGSTSPYGDAPQALIEHWDGATWTSMPAPSTGEQYSVLNGVSCTDSTDCFAVGFDGSGSTEGALGTEQLLLERWNGTSWGVVQSGNPLGDTVSVLTGVSCVPAQQVQLGFCAAVGYASSDGVARTLTEKLQDGVWQVVASPNADLGNDIL